MGLGSILLLALFGGSTIHAGMQNLDCKSHAERLPNGVKYYIDRRGTARLWENDEIIHLWGDGTVQHNKSGKIIYDQKTAENQEAASKIKEGQKYRYAQQHHDRCDNVATVDLDTGKVIAQVEEKLFKDGHSEYRKWYLYDCYRELYGPYVDLRSYVKVNPNCIKMDDPGILITAEEFNAINTCPKIYCRYSHKLLINGEEDVTFFAYSKLNLTPSKDVEEMEIKRGKEWKKKGHGDGWYGTLHDIYVKDGMVVSKKLKNKNGETYTGFPYEKKVGGRYIRRVISYESYLEIMNDEDISPWEKVWFR